MNRAAGKAGSGAVVIGSVVLGVGLGTLTLGPWPLGHLSFSGDSDPRAMLIGVFQGSLGLLAIVFAVALLLGQIGRAMTYSPRIIGYALGWNTVFLLGLLGVNALLPLFVAAAAPRDVRWFKLSLLLTGLSLEFVALCLWSLGSRVSPAAFWTGSRAAPAGPWTARSGLRRSTTPSSATASCSSSVPPPRSM